MKINLINNGIFPIIYDENGDKIQSNNLDTGLEVAGCIQGEGMYQGVPSLFIRTSGCNLRCLFTSKDKKHNFCDTSYSSFKPEKNLMEVETVAKIIRNNIGNMKHLVVTGGEPMLQADALIYLFRLIKDLNLKITIETNGTVYDEEMIPYIDLLSISPKLKNSEPTKDKLADINYNLNHDLINQHISRRYNLEVLVDLIRASLGIYSYPKGKPKLQLKFVVTSPEDLKEIIENYLSAIELFVGKENAGQYIYLMPEGITEEELKEKGKWLIGECIKNGFRYCPRLHIEIYGGKVRFV
jgi:7-carboxy-7-deazaguanine synthase